MNNTVNQGAIYLDKFSNKCLENPRINPDLYIEEKVYRGLRDVNGKGVLTGLTKISDIISKKIIDGETVPCPGELYYRGYDVKELVSDFLADDRFGFEEVIYLLILFFGTVNTFPTSSVSRFFHVFLSSSV